ncbi:MAG: phosphomannomutase/phosphoglucomutase [Sedimenticola sp.]
MKIKKSGTAEKSKPAKVAGAVSVGGLVSQSLAAVVIVLALVGGAIAFLQGQAEEGAESPGLETAAQILAGRLADVVSQQVGVATGFIQDARLVNQVRSENWSGVRAMEAELRKLLPSVREVHFLPLDADEKDGGSSLPISFAALAQVKAVERSRSASLAEMHQFGSDKRNIAIALPIRESKDDSLSGVAHLSFSPGLVDAAFAGIKAPGGRLEIQQEAGEQPLTLQHLGESAGGEATGSVSVPGTIWRVVYWNSAPPAGPMLIYMGVIGAGALLIILVLQLFSVRLGRALKADEVIIAELLNAGQAGKGRLPNPRLAEHMGIFKMLARAKPGAAVVAQAAQKGTEEAAEDEELEIDSSFVTDSAMVESAPVAGGSLPKSIFLAYDIRGVVGETLTTDVVFELGRAIGSEAYDRGQQTVIVGRDGRDSGETLSDALCRGLMDSGRDVVRIGMVPTPLLYFATNFLGSNCGVMVTGSHNPLGYNGLKIVLGGEALQGDSIQALRTRVESGNLLQGNGMAEEQQLIPDYISRVVEDIQLARTLKVVVDSGNGVAGLVAPKLLRELGCDVVELFSEVDGSFPNHHPDPGRPENMQALASVVREHKADIGIAFDGDGDRLGVVDCNGKIIWPDRLLMLFARDVLARQPGSDVIFDVKSTRHLATEVLAYGGRPIMSRTGHSPIKAKMKETGALLAGEMSGHIFFKERWYGFDDGLYSCARLLEILSTDPRTSDEVFAELPESESTPELHMAISAEEGIKLLAGMVKVKPFPDAKVVTMDGVRVEFRDGWGLARVSNTTPAMVFRFEADTPDALQRIQQMFSERLMALDSSLQLPF